MFNKKNNMWSTALIGIIMLGLLMVGACKKGTREVLEAIVLDIGQSGWNLSSANGGEMLEVFLVGEGVEKILLDSIEMKGDNTAAPPLKPASANYQGTRVRAEFRKNEVRILLSNPSAGSTHTITVIFYMTDSSEPTEVQSQVTVTETSEDNSELTLEIDPVEWSLNFTNSAGTVEAFIRGEGIDNIDLNSIEMQGDNPVAATLALAALSASRQGDHIHARFPKNQVIGLLLDPAEGTVHTITVSFLEVGGTERTGLTAEITIEDDEDDEINPEELELEIDPGEWSLNFPKSSGTVEAFIKGEGIENIDLNSIEMSGDNLEALSLSAGSVSINKRHIHAKFPKNQVIDLLLNPAEGTTHTITVSFLEIGGTERIKLTAEITIEEDEDDDDDGDDEEPSDLTLQLSPSTWNLNYSTSSGSVKAFIRGDGIEAIDLDSIEMMGDNTAALPLPATSAALNGNHVQATFPKNQVLDLLLNPDSGTVHTVTVTFMNEGGGARLVLSTEVTITGKAK